MLPEHEAPTIVVVEDNADNLLVVEILLTEDVGAQCLGVASGTELWTLLHDQPGLIPDAILLDLQLPREDGFAVLAQLRTLSHLAHVRVVAVTANVMSEHVDRVRAAGFDGFIGKPIDRHRFPEQMIRLLQGRAVWEAR